MSARALATLLLALSPAGAGALEVPPTPSAYCTDLAGVLSSGQAAAIDRRLEGLETRTGHQVIAVLLPSLEGENLEDFTMRCSESWKVGRPGINDGAVFLAFTRDRRMRLEIGYGLEGTIPDAVARRILDNAVKPAFVTGDYGGGLVALADSLDRLFRGESLPERVPRRERPGPAFLIALLAGVVLLRMLSARARWSTGYRGGPFWGGFGGSGGGWSGGGFSAGGGSFGGGGASGSW